ncbi:MAG: hypothetical protein ABIQ91_00020 [Candidatus Paceibacterota bacterium]
MFYSIDYYSFTIPIRAPYGVIDHEAIRSTVNTFVTLLPEDIRHKFGFGSWGIEKGTGFYSTRLRHEITGVALSIGGTNAHIFIEFSGRACYNFEAGDHLLPLIQATHERCSRVDFAVDIETETLPTEFSTHRKGSAFKSNGTINSPSGQTCYIGARASERMVRVYRYYKPHPRSNILRVEAEYKGDAAKASSKHLLEVGLQQACLDAHAPFGWQHIDWDTEGETGEKLTYKSYNPSNANTIRWLYGDVITALRKAIENGIVDLDDWLAKLAGDSK